MQAQVLRCGVLRRRGKDLGDGLVQQRRGHGGVEPGQRRTEVDDEHRIRGRRAAGVEIGAVDRTPPELAQVVVGEEFEVVFEHEP